MGDKTQYWPLVDAEKIGAANVEGGLELDIIFLCRASSGTASRPIIRPIGAGGRGGKVSLGEAHSRGSSPCPLSRSTLRGLALTGFSERYPGQLFAGQLGVLSNLVSLDLSRNMLGDEHFSDLVGAFADTN